MSDIVRSVQVRPDDRSRASAPHRWLMAPLLGRLRATCLRVLLLLSVGAAADRAFAHAPVEILQFVSLAPEQLLLATNRGLIFGQLAPRAFHFLCAEALGIAVGEPYRVARLRSGRLMVASARGLMSSEDRGCTWQATGLWAVNVSELALDPADPSTLYVATEAPGASGIQVSRDGGAHFELLLTLADDESVQSLLVVAGAPARLYASVRGGPALQPHEHYVIRSADGGGRWERVPLTLASNERGLTLLAAHGGQADALLARASSSLPQLGERALYSADGARTFAPVATLRMLRAAAFSTSGTYAYLAGVDGVFRAPLATLTFEQLTESAWISQLQAGDDSLFAAGYYQGIAQSNLERPNHGVGVASEHASSFQPWLSFHEVSELLSCPAPAPVEAACAAALEHWRLENPAPPGSSPDAEISHLDAGVPRPSPSDEIDEVGASDASQPLTGHETATDAGHAVASMGDDALDAGARRWDAGAADASRDTFDARAAIDAPDAASASPTPATPMGSRRRAQSGCSLGQPTVAPPWASLLALSSAVVGLWLSRRRI